MCRAQVAACVSAPCDAARHTRDVVAPEGGDRLVVEVVGALGAEDRVHAVRARQGREKWEHRVQHRACETSLRVAAVAAATLPRVLLAGCTTDAASDQRARLRLYEPLHVRSSLPNCGFIARRGREHGETGARRAVGRSRAALDQLAQDDGRRCTTTATAVIPTATATVVGRTTTATAVGRTAATAAALRAQGARGVQDQPRGVAHRRGGDDQRAGPA